MKLSSVILILSSIFLIVPLPLLNFLGVVSDGLVGVIASTLILFAFFVVACEMLFGINKWK